MYILKWKHYTFEQIWTCHIFNRPTRECPADVKSIHGIYKPNQTSIAAQQLFMPPALQYSVLQIPQWRRTVCQRVDDISCCTVTDDGPCRAILSSTLKRYLSVYCVLSFYVLQAFPQCLISAKGAKLTMCPE